MKFYLIILQVFILILSVFAKIKVTPDPNGYILYCPCMGRFGNQADHFLGSLSFAKAVNRTLVLPHWVEYPKGALESNQVPFDEYFNIEPIKEYHRVILMWDFMEHYAEDLWPYETRTSFCYMARKKIGQKSSEKSTPSCEAKDGNPFGPFWDTFNIVFINSEFYSPLHFDITHTDIAEKWKKNYNPEKWPVIAFTGAPAHFPVEKENTHLQRFLEWSDKYNKMADDFIKNKLPKGAFIGIHLRNGVDWIRACAHISTSKQLFSSPQCLGYKNEKGILFKELCMQTVDLVIRQIKRTVKNFNAGHSSNKIKSIFIASDSNHLINEINNAMERMGITAHKLENDNPHLDLAILGRSNFFIGNCISSYSAFVKRERDAKGFPSAFWSFPKEKELKKHEEL